MSGAKYLKKLPVEASAAQLELLDVYARLVLDKSELLNITRANGLKEIWQRHIADGLHAAVAARPLLENIPAPVIADAGAGGGYIGFALAIMFPQAKTSVIESVERKCAFMNWAAVKTPAPVNVINKRLEPKSALLQADLLVERAMGKLEDILPACAANIKQGGHFLAFQTDFDPQAPGTAQAAREAGLAFIRSYDYALETDAKPRVIAIFKKEG